MPKSMECSNPHRGRHVVQKGKGSSLFSQRGMAHALAKDSATYPTVSIASKARVETKHLTSANPGGRKLPGTDPALKYEYVVLSCAHRSRGNRRASVEASAFTTARWTTPQERRCCLTSPNSFKKSPDKLCHRVHSFRPRNREEKGYWNRFAGAS